MSEYSERAAKVFCIPLESGLLGVEFARGISLSPDEMQSSEPELRRKVRRRFQMLTLSFRRKTAYTLHEIETGHEPNACDCDPKDILNAVNL